MKHYFRNIVMPSLLAFLVSSSAFGQQPEEERSRLYGGPDSGGTVNKSIITYDSVEWQTAWFKNLGGFRHKNCRKVMSVSWSSPPTQGTS